MCLQHKPQLQFIIMYNFSMKKLRWPRQSTKNVSISLPECGQRQDDQHPNLCILRWILHFSINEVRIRQISLAIFLEFQMYYVPLPKKRIYFG